ncbi:MAG: hypothetical protein KDK35_02585 [Leptospiraceae bacterium]|nr:hypothetical protein [Leptospiraceae bacterium]MCP5486592.1 hypothetical protein [Spirochaetales bacterium]
MAPAEKQASPGASREQLAVLPHLVRVLYEALFWSPLDNLRGIVGRLRDLGRPSTTWSELYMLHIRTWSGFRRLLSFVVDVFLLPFGLRRRLRVLFGQALGREQPPPLLRVPGLSGYEDESWFYMNGVATNETMALESGRYIAAIFRRPVTVIPNFTRSLLPDLLQVTAQKGYAPMTGAGARALAAIGAALRDPNCGRVVVLAHSQGAVVIGRVLLALDHDRLVSSSDLEKLEVYTFGNPSDLMSTVRRIGALEHFANRRDLVARLGVLAQRSIERGSIHIDGPVFVADRYGHFFNEHYLHGVETRAFVDSRGRASARLYSYLNGAVPALPLEPAQQV